MILGRNSVGAKVAVNVCRTGQKKKKLGRRCVTLRKV